MLSPAQLTIKTSGSATGNPRNKCALKPGHSLMDWIRLGNSGADLTGFLGRIVPISAEELAKHNKREDAWLAIRGKVYNVTRYMDFHPGGVDELMRGVGRDATKLFDEVHAWVNYQQLLAKCYIGPLKSVVKLDKDVLSALTTKKNSNSLGLPPLPIKSLSAEIIPRFDWIQKQSDLTLYFYTRQDCNPGLIVQHKNARQLNVSIVISNTSHQFEFDFHAAIDWPPKATHVNSETGKIEINFAKTVEALWTTYGTQMITKKPTWCMEEETTDSLPYSFKVCLNEKFNHDSFELCLNSDNCIIVPAVGFHVTLAALIEGRNVSRSYTPVSQQFAAKSVALPSSCLRFLIKNYGEHGEFSTYLSQLSNGATLELSAPKGSFQTKVLQNRKEVILLAAGSGITPCLSMIAHIFTCRTTKIERILLAYFNKSEADIWCHDQLQHLANSDERFKFINILSQPDDDWKSFKGRISNELLTDIIGKNNLTAETFFGICGPSGFNDLAEICLGQLNCNKENVHIFQG